MSEFWNGFVYGCFFIIVAEISLLIAYAIKKRG